ncbi:tautomerase family protein [Mesorhizobium sp. M0622]
MPTINVKLLKGRSVDQKRELVEVVTPEAARILKMPARRHRYRVRGYQEA